MPDGCGTGNAPLKPRRPYLLRALHEWISDSGETPHIVVDAAGEGVTVPRQYVKDGKIVLNVSFSATQALKLGNDAVSFEARFGGVSFAVQVPVRSILGIYARETGQGMIFPEGDADPDPTDAPPTPAGRHKGPARRRPSGRSCKWSNSRRSAARRFLDAGRGSGRATRRSLRDPGRGSRACAWMRIVAWHGHIPDWKISWTSRPRQPGGPRSCPLPSHSRCCT